MTKCTIVGAGNLGTALAQLISHNVDQVYLFSRKQTIVDHISQKRFNPEHFPSITLSSNIIPTTNLEQCLNVEILFICVPSSAVREVARTLYELGYMNIVVSTAKGIEYPSAKRMSAVITEELHTEPVVFSGPTFASEIIYNLPTITTIASRNNVELEKVKNVLATDNFIVKITHDVIGTEFSGILKNIAAMAYGICEGMGINENAISAVLTKAFIEMKEIVVKVGGHSSTFDSYCGFGDLILTSTSKKSRNHTLGTLYGQRISIDEQSSGVLFEGKKSLLGVKKICDDEEIKSEIIDFAVDVICNKSRPEVAFKKLWSKLN